MNFSYIRGGISMRATPGGVLAANEVVGRDELIEQLWDLLERQSIVLSAERRMGKTSVIRKMHQERPDTFRTFYQDLEGINTPAEFVEAVYREIQSMLSGGTRTSNRFRRVLKDIGGSEFAGI